MKNQKKRLRIVGSRQKLAERAGATLLPVTLPVDGEPITVRVPVSFEQYEDDEESNGQLRALDLAIKPLLEARYPGGPRWLNTTTRKLTYTWGEYEAVLKEHLLTQFPNDGHLTTERKPERSWEEGWELHPGCGVDLP